MTLDLNQPAPDFTLLNQDDEQITLSNYRGKWVVVYFYPKDDTPGCTKEACDFTESLPDYDNLNAVILGISPDSPESHRKFIEKYKLNITLLSDPEKLAHKPYGAWGLKKNYGKEYEGVIRSTFIIDPDGNLAKSWKKVQVRAKRKNGEVKHVDFVKTALEEFQA